MSNQIKTILLAAGQSNRVKPVEDKNFLSFAGKYLIEWQINELIMAGITDFIIVCNEKNISDIKDFTVDMAEAYDNALTFEYALQKEKTGMAGGINACKDLISDEPVLIVSSNDVIESKAYIDVLESQTKEQGAILGIKVDEYFPGGYLKMEGDKLKEIVEKPGEGKEPSDLVNIVVHAHPSYKRLTDAIQHAQSKHDDIYEVALSSLIKAGDNYEVVAYDGYWQALKFPWHIFKLDEYFLCKRMTEAKDSDEYQEIEDALIHKDAIISDTAVIKGTVLIEADVRIYENAVIIGPSYIEEGTIIGNNSLVRESSIGQNCVIGFTSEVARSHIGDKTWTHTNYIGDSIIGSNVSFGAGAVTANLRLDEDLIKWQGKKSQTNKLGVVMGDNIRVGIQTSLMPGVAVHSNSMIGSGIIIGEDVEEGEFIYGKTELVRKKNKLNVEDLMRDV